MRQQVADSVKVKLSLSTPWYRMGGSAVQLHSFLTSTLHRDEWSVSCSGRSSFRKRAPVTHLIGGWVDPRASLNALDNSGPYGERNRDSRVLQALV
jgi:hypothetical protein